MKIVVNAGRTVHTVEKPAVKGADGGYSRPICKAHGPTRRLDLPADEAKLLIARGFAREDKPAPEAPKDSDPK